MASNRKGHTTEKHKLKGATLISVVLISIAITLMLAGMYYALTKLFKTSENLKIYTSTREAAIGGVNYAISSGAIFSIIYSQPCPNGQNPVNNCCNFTLKYTLKGTNNVFNNQIEVCFVGYQPQAGYKITGVANSRDIGGKGYIFRIISQANGPQNSANIRVETLYTP